MKTLAEEREEAMKTLADKLEALGFGRPGVEIDAVMHAMADALAALREREAKLVEALDYWCRWLDWRDFDSKEAERLTHAALALVQPEKEEFHNG